MDFDKLQKDVTELEKAAAGFEEADAASMKAFAVGLREILIAFLKDRKEPVRPGQLFRDAAAKNIVPGDIAPRADALLVRWSGGVTPQDAQTLKDEAAKFASVAGKVMPILKAYQKKP
jgi:hypothetical protein